MGPICPAAVGEAMVGSPILKVYIDIYYIYVYIYIIYIIYIYIYISYIYISYIYISYIYGWWYTYPSENVSSSVGMMNFPTEWKVIKAMFQTTNRIIYNQENSYKYHIYIYVTINY